MLSLRTLILSLLLTSQSVAWAAPNTLDLLRTIENQAEVENGFAMVEPYNLNTFALKAEVSRQPRKVNGDCRLEVSTGRRRAIAQIASDNVNDVQTSRLLKRLYQAGKIKAIVSGGWDWGAGDSEYCSIYRFSVFTTDGYKLTLNYDLTD